MRRPVWLLILLAAGLACNPLTVGRPLAPQSPASLPSATVTNPLRASRPPATATAASLAATATAASSATAASAAAATLAATATPVAAATEVAAASAVATATTSAPAKGRPATTGVPAPARACDFVPGVSVPAAMPASVAAEGTPTPEPPAPLPANTAVDAATTARHLQVFGDLIRTIQTEYIYTDVVKTRLPGLQRQYQALVAAGLTDDNFYVALDDLITALGDDHSSFESPAEAKTADGDFAGDRDFVGLGLELLAVPQAGRAVVVVVYPGSPAAEAGLRVHDSIVAVDGQPVLDAHGYLLPTLRGPAGSTVALTLQRPGQTPFVARVQRRRVTGPLPIDACLIPSRHIGYLYLPGLDDETVPAQVRAALRSLTATGPLTGLVIDNRQNGGGLATVLDGLLSLFTGGNLGRFVSRDAGRDLVVQPQDVGGSQTVPLLVLVSRDTVSYGEVLSGLLQVTGRAKVLGQASLGNVETEWPYTFKDGSRVWLAHELFQPPGLPVAAWEGVGIHPDISLPVRWDLFSAATDPALAAAVDYFDRFAHTAP